MRNPINIAEDGIKRAGNVAIFALRAKIHSARAKKLSMIDLRMYKSNPDKKNRIRSMINEEYQKVAALCIQMILEGSQPIRTNYPKGGEIAEINYK